MTSALQVLSHDGAWSRWILPDGDCVAVIRPTGIDIWTGDSARDAVSWDDTVGIIVQTEARTYHVLVPQVLTFKNADRHPALPVSELHSGDRLTYYTDPAGQPTRVWCLWQPVLSADATCGYCREAIAGSEPVAACPACGEIMHEACRVHSQGRCARCGTELVSLADLANRRPIGFEEAEADDEA